ncbi:MAG: hypothetical protein ACM3IJ_00725 [Candidatus Levyibacteriota bacterium]
MSKERQVASEVLKKGGILVAVLSAVVDKSAGVFAGILAYFIGREIQPKAV